MIAGAMLNELHNINPTTKTYILIVRKDSNTSAHCSSLRGDEQLGIFPHPTNKYDMLCISNFVSAETFLNI